MPKDKNIQKVLLIGSGPIIVSQGCEFDYSGTQACKALKEEGCKVILVNPNPATIMTDPTFADAIYIEPLIPAVLEKIIKKEKPDSLLPTMGGQTALNVALELDACGILKKYNVKIIGVTINTIKKSEDRGQFRTAVQKIQLDCPKSLIIKSLQDLDRKKNIFEYPKMLRTSYTLGGSGSGIAYNDKQLLELCTQAFNVNPTNTIIIEESLLGWKEFELEVMIDKMGNFIVICPIENLDPMGVHTGDSITVAPTQTLTNREYQLMREAAKKLVKEIGMTSGGCNVQFAINPTDGRMVVIEINPRVSRSSALASKATGFLIAKIATKIALGYNLSELSNDISQGQIPASFEPSIDYVVVKIPRFNFDKFPEVDSTLTTQMKSIGEVMGIGRTFLEALQKAFSSLDDSTVGLIPHTYSHDDEQQDLIYQKLITPNMHRLFYIFEALRNGWTIEKIAKLTSIDLWFLYNIKKILDIEACLKGRTLSSIPKEDILFLKREGFSDYHIGVILNEEEKNVHSFRKINKIKPVYKRIDSCAAEFPTKTSYLYSTYEDECESKPSKNDKIIILGSGANRIGQGIEFDYCCVHATKAVRELGYESIIINCNPETVSTDYDSCDKLYFEPLTLENVTEIIDIEKPIGILSQFGGQTSLGLAQLLNNKGYNILGTQQKYIKEVEDRISFKRTLDKNKIKQPPSSSVKNLNEGLLFAKQVEYPLIVRSSFVIGGKGFAKITSETELKKYFLTHPPLKPILIEKFIDDALEIDVDAISDGENITICGILEQFEAAGIHSGDSICILPSQNISPNLINEIISLTKKMAMIFKVIGFVNIQFIIKNNNIYVLEINARASRTVPFVCKSTGIPFVSVATKVLLGVSLKEQGYSEIIVPPLVTIKIPIFSFGKLLNTKNKLGIEMKSTGEVMAVGKTKKEVMNKLLLYQDLSKNLHLLEEINVYDTITFRM